ncbi:uncharacterized protein [Oscarella lobularis]|uniref:uncharacterized protein n=1 Tax=Oscarella lobularis TaxID=121494 RepID=UPI0033135B9A
MIAPLRISSMILNILSCVAVLLLSTVQSKPLVHDPTPPHPHFPSTFEAQFRVIIKANVTAPNGTNAGYGEGHWAVDYEGNKSVVRYDIHEPHHEEVKNLYLERHDLGYKYFVTSANKSACQKVKVEGRLSYTWTYVEDATYVKRGTYKGEQLDFWEGRAGSNGTEVLTGVYVDNPNEPAVIQFHAAEEAVNFTITYEMTEFKSKVPPASDFEVPKVCQEEHNYDRI